MKRYAVFAWDDYYPSGGMGNFVKSFNDQHDAFVYAEQLKERQDAWIFKENVEIFDMEEYE